MQDILLCHYNTHKQMFNSLQEENEWLFSSDKSRLVLYSLNILNNFHYKVCFLFFF
jgi:hypothetical protein